MKKSHWFALTLTLGLLVVLLGVAGGRLARLVSAEQAAPGKEPGKTALAPQLSLWFINIRVADSIDNLEPAVAYNSNHDEYLVVWWDDQGSTYAVYAQRVDSDGTLKGSQPITVVHSSGYKNWQPDVAYSPTHDEYLIVYTYEASASDYDVWARRVAWDGSWMSSEIRINGDSDIQWNPAVAYNSDADEYLVVYENWWAGGLRDIAAQRVRASDGALQSWRNIATGTGELRTYPDVAYDPAQNYYLIAYTYQSSAGADGDIFGKVTSWNMGYLSNEIQIINNTNLQDDVALAASENEYLAVWQDGPSTSWRTIYGRRISGDGSLPSNPFLIAEHTNKVLAAPAVGYGAGYGYLVTWEYDTQATSDYDIYARYVMPGQDQAAGEEFAIDDGDAAQRNPAVACNSIGDCLLVEQDNYGVTDYEIRGRFVWPYHVYLPITLRNYQ